MLRAVLFDLDDTLFDHRGCAREALAAVQSCDAALTAIPLSRLEALHSSLLEQLHADVMLGRVPLEHARRERFRRLLRDTGGDAPEPLVALAAAAYRDRYRDVRRAVRGARELLAGLRGRVKVGIVSNNLFDEQLQKLDVCGLQRYVDTLVVSERVGASKPDPAIFIAALEQLRCEPQEAVMVGDSFAADVAGARGARIRPVWFNPLGLPLPEGEASVAQLTSLGPVQAALAVILDGLAVDDGVEMNGGDAEV